MMRRKKIFAWVVLAALCLPWVSHASDPRILSLSRKKVGDLHYPEVQFVDLKNGIRVYFLEDHDLPTFQMFAYIRAGGAEEPADRVGLASLLGSLLRTGGTEKRSVEEIDRLLEDHGAELSTGAGSEYASADLKCLSNHQDLFVPLFFEILRSPRFDSKKLDLARLRRIESLKRVNDSASKIASQEYPKLLYGEASPWARTPTSETLNRITREDLLAFHHRYYGPERVILAVSGDFKRDELIRRIEEATQGWEKSPAGPSTVSPVKKEWEGGLYGISKKGAQSTLYVGHFGEKRFNPDKFALILMNFMLGGDIFSSRLGEEVRSNRGLAYSIYSHFGLESEYGLFYASAQTRSEATGEVIGLIGKEIGRFHDGQDFSQASLNFAKESILNQLVSDWEPRFNYVKERARLHFYGYPEDYFKTYRTKLGEVSLDEIKAVAKKYLFPDRLKILVVGDLDQIDGSLKKFGEMKRIPLKQY